MVFLSKNDRNSATNATVKACVAFLDQCDPAQLANGKHAVTEDIFCNVMEYNTKADSDIFETHRNFVDVQVLAAGAENIGLPTGKGDFQPYLEENDNEPCTAEGKQYVTIQAGDLCVLLPGEPHLPGLAIAESVPVKKLVFKIPGELYARG